MEDLFDGTAYELGVKIMDFIENMDECIDVTHWMPLPEPHKED